MSLSAQCLLDQLKQIIEDEKITDTGAMVVQKQVAEGEKVLDLDISSSVMNTILHPITSEIEHMCLHEAVRLRNAPQICQSKAD